MRKTHVGGPHTTRTESSTVDYEEGSTVDHKQGSTVDSDGRGRFYCCAAASLLPCFCGAVMYVHTALPVLLLLVLHFFFAVSAAAVGVGVVLVLLISHEVIWHDAMVAY